MINRIKTLLGVMLVAVLLPVNNIYGDEIALYRNSDDNGNYYYLPSEIPLPSDDVAVVTAESTTEDFLEDYDGNKWSLYSVTLQAYGDGSDEAYESIIDKLKNNDYTSQSYTDFELESEAAVNIDGTDYHPTIDTVIVSAGDQISVKNMNGTEYEEDKQNGWSVIVQYYLSRYSDEDYEKCSAIDDKDDDLMRVENIQISLLYPSDESIGTYFSSSGSKSETTISTDNMDKVQDRLAGENSEYTSEKKDNTLIIKDSDNKEVLKVTSNDDKEYKVTVKDKSLDTEEVEDLINDVALSLIDDGSGEINITYNDDGSYIVTNPSGDNSVYVSKGWDGSYTLNLLSDGETLTSEDTGNVAGNATSTTNNSMTFAFTMLLVVVLIVMAGLIVTIVVVNKKKHNGNKHNK